MRIIAYKTSSLDGRVLLEESTGEHVLSNNLTELFTFLLNEYDDTFKVTWSLDEMVSPLLKLLGKVACRRLRESKKYYEGGFSIFYIPDKIFSLTYGQRLKANLYGLEQYFPEVAEPPVNEIQAAGAVLLRELDKMGFHPTKLTSPIAIYEESILSKLDLPVLKDIPKEAAEMAARTAGHLWIEAHTLGQFEAVYDYDLSSAHPMAQKDLVDLRDCRWLQSKEYQDMAVFGFVKAKMTIYDWVVLSPIMMDTEEALISPAGTWEGWFTKSELDFITKWKIGEFEIQDGWWAVTTRRAFRKPFLVPMENLLKYKQGDELQRLLAKRMSTGIYGKMLEERTDEFGPFYNPVYGSYVSTNVRLQVADYLYSNDIGPGDNEGYKHLLHISVDGFMLDCPLEDIPLPYEKEKE